ncbi:FUSC family protein [Micromonospora tulbaghiae]|uniref:FUSC family protein n=1 Tax=Micromonospora tulbaghiae TaxID=479978 RepID=UPI003AFF8D8F
MNERGRAAGRDRMQQLRIKSVLAVQAGLAAALAWAVARWLTGMPSPIFAPAAAVAVITSSFGRRLSNTVELLAGVTLGIIVSDLLIGAVGAGVWQTGVIVTASVLVALALSTRVVPGGGQGRVPAGGHQAQRGRARRRAARHAPARPRPRGRLNRVTTARRPRPGCAAAPPPGPSRSPA